VQEQRRGVSGSLDHGARQKQAKLAQSSETAQRAAYLKKNEFCRGGRHEKGLDKEKKNQRSERERVTHHKLFNVHDERMAEGHDEVFGHYRA